MIKLIPLLTDSPMRAMFAADKPGLDLDYEMSQGYAVFYDFQGEQDPVRRRLKLMWCFRNHVEYVRLRGVVGRQNPILYVIDELTQLLGQHTMTHSIMADDINELTTVIARNYGLNLCIMHQNLGQIDEHTQVSLSQMGTQIIGWVQQPQDCLQLAEQFMHYDPKWARKREPVWMNVQQGLGPYAVSEPQVIDYTTTEYSIDEQRTLLADRFRTLGRFHFLVRTASAEGTLSNRLQPMNIEKLDPGCYPDDAQVAEVQRRLRKRDGVPLATLLAGIEERQRGALRVAASQRSQPHAILSPDQGEPTDDAPTDRALSKPAPTDDDFWEKAP